MNKITEHEAQQMRNANATGRQPVVFVHGLWLLPSSWDRWAALFEEAGYTALTPGWPVLGNPANRNRAVPLTFDQFRYAFANAVTEQEAKELYENFAVPAAGKPLFQAAAANLNPWTEAKVDTESEQRGPLLIVSGQKDHTVPPAIARASFRQQQGNAGATEMLEIPDRGHALTIDHGWREVAEKSLAFVQRFARP